MQNLLPQRILPFALCQKVLPFCAISFAASWKSMLEVKFLKSSAPGCFCLLHTHRTTGEKRGDGMLRWIVSRSMHSKSRLSHLLTNQCKAVLLALISRGFRTLCSLCTFLGKMMQKALFSIPKPLGNLVRS